MKRKGFSEPILVGDEAFELYTQGHYTTGDIDIKSPRAGTLAILKDMGFTPAGRSNMYSERLDILMDWQGESLEEGKEAEERTVIIQLDEEDKDMRLRLVSLEDLIIDRLCAA